MSNQNSIELDQYEDVIDFCRSKNDIAKACEVCKDNELSFIIVMDDSTIDENVLNYNEFGFDMLKKYGDINDFMVLDVITSSGIGYMFDEVNIIYERDKRSADGLGA